MQENEDHFEAREANPSLFSVSQNKIYSGSIWLNWIAQIVTTSIVLLTLVYLSPAITRWFVSEGIHGDMSFLLVPSLVIALLLPNANERISLNLPILLFSLFRGSAIALLLVMLIWGNLLNRGPVVGLCFCVLLFFSLLNTFVPFVQIFVCKELIKSCLRSNSTEDNGELVEKNLTYQSLLLYFGKSRNKGTNSWLAFCDWLGELRRKPALLSIFGSQVLSETFLKASEENTNDCIDSIFSDKYEDSVVVAIKLKSLLYAVDVEYRLQLLASETRGEKYPNLYVQRFRYVVFTVAQSITPNASNEDIFSAQCGLVEFLLLVSRNSSDDKTTPALDQIYAGLSERKSPRKIFNAYTKLASSKYSVESYFIRGLSAILLEQMDYVSLAFKLLESESEKESKTVDQLDELKLFKMSLAKVQVSMALRLGYGNETNPEIRHLFLDAIVNARYVHHASLFNLIREQSINIEGLSSREPLKKSDHALRSKKHIYPVKKIFLGATIQSGGGEISNVAVFFSAILLITIASVVPFFTTFQSDVVPALKDPFREFTILDTNNLSFAALKDTLFIGTEQKGVHVIDTSNFKISSERSLSTDGPQDGAHKLLVADSINQELYSNITRGNNSGLDVRNAEGNWETLIKASGLEINGTPKLQGVFEYSNASVDPTFLISNTLVGYDQLLRELYILTIRPNLYKSIPSKFDSITGTHDSLIAIAGDSLYFGTPEEGSLELMPAPIPAGFGAVKQVECMPGGNFFVRTSTKALFRGILESGSVSWELILGGEQFEKYPDRKVLTVGSDSWELILGGEQFEKYPDRKVLTVGSDSSAENTWIYFSSNNKVYLALRSSQAGKYWSIVDLGDKELLNLDIDPVIHPAGNKILVATKANTVEYSVNKSYKWVFDNHKIINENWKPLSFDYTYVDKIHKVLIAQEKTGGFNRKQIVEYDWTKVGPANIDTQSSPLNGNIIHVSGKDANGELLFVDSTLNSSVYDLESRRFSGDDQLILTDKLISDIAWQDGKLMIAHGNTSITGTDGIQHTINTRDTFEDVHAAWDINNGFSVVDKAGVGWNYDLSIGWSKSSNLVSSKIDIENIQRRSDGGLVALSVAGDLLLFRNNQWRNSNKEPDVIFASILSSIHSTMLMSRRGEIWEFNNNEFTRIRNAPNTDLQLTLPLIDFAVCKEDGVDYMFVSDQKCVSIYCPSTLRWTKCKIKIPGKFRLFSTSGSSVLAWNKDKQYLADITFDGKVKEIATNILSFDVNAAGKLVALKKDGSVQLFNSVASTSNEIVSATALNLTSKPVSATVLKDKAIITSTDGVFQIDNMGRVNQISSEPFKQIAAIDNLLIGLDASGICYAWKGLAASNWLAISTPYTDRPVIRMYELEDRIVCIQNNGAVFLIHPNSSVSPLLPGKRELFTGIGVGESYPVAQFNGATYLATGDDHVVEWTGLNGSSMNLHSIEQIVRFQIVKDELFAMSLKSTYQLIDSEFKKICDWHANAIVNINNDLFLLSEKQGLQKLSTNSFEYFSKLSSGLGKVRDVLSSGGKDSPLVLIEEGYGIVFYDQKTRNLVRQRSSSPDVGIEDVGLFGSNDKIIYCVSSNSGNLHLDLRRLAKLNTPISQLQDIKSYAKTENGFSVINSKGSLLHWDEGIGGWKTPYEISQGIGSVKAKKFIPFSTTGAFVFTDSSKIFKYEPGVRHEFIRLGNATLIADDIWPWASDSILISSNQKLFELNWSGNAKQVGIHEKISEVIPNANGVAYRVDDRIYQLNKSDRRPILLWESAAQGTRYPGDPLVTWRVDVKNPEDLLVFDGDTLHTYYGNIGNWDRNNEIQSFAAISNPQIEFKADGPVVIYDDGLLSSSGNVQTVGRPYYQNSENVFYIPRDKAKDLYLNDKKLERSWEKQKSDFYLPIVLPVEKEYCKFLFGGSVVYAGKHKSISFTAGMEEEVAVQGVKLLGFGLGANFGATLYDLEQIGFQGKLIFDSSSEKWKILLNNNELIVKELPILNGSEFIGFAKGGFLFQNAQTGSLYKMYSDDDKILVNAVKGESGSDNQDSFGNALILKGLHNELLLTKSGNLYEKMHGSEQWKFKFTVPNWDSLRSFRFFYDNDDALFFEEHIGSRPARLYIFDSTSSALKPLSRSYYVLESKDGVYLGKSIFRNIKRREPVTVASGVDLLTVDSYRCYDLKSNVANALFDDSGFFAKELVFSVLDKEIFMTQEISSTNLSPNTYVHENYLHFEGYSDHLDVDITTSRYRGGELQELLVRNDLPVLQLVNGLKLDLAGSKIAEVAHKPSFTHPIIQGEYSYKRSGFSRLISGRPLAYIGSIEKGEPFRSEVIKDAKESFNVNESSLEIIDKNGQLWIYNRKSRLKSRALSLSREIALIKQINSGRAYDLRWFEDGQNGLEFKLNNELFESVTVNLKHGDFEYDLPVLPSRILPSRSGERVISLNSTYIVRDLPTKSDNVFVISSREYIHPDLVTNYILNTSFGTVRVGNGAVDFIVTGSDTSSESTVYPLSEGLSRFPWDEVSDIAIVDEKIVTSSQAIPMLTVNTADRFFFDTDDSFTSKIDLASKYERWKIDSGKYLLSPGVNDIGFRIIDSDLSIPVNWFSDKGCFGFEYANFTTPSSIDSNIELATRGSSFNLLTFDGLLSFDRSGRIGYRHEDVKPIAIKRTTQDSTLTVYRDQENSGVYFNSIDLLGSEVKKDVHNNWQVENGRLPIAQFDQVCIDDIGNVIMKSEDLLQVVNDKKVISKLCLDGSFLELSHSLKSNQGVLAFFDGDVYANSYKNWTKVPKSRWDQSKFSEENYSYSLGNLGIQRKANSSNLIRFNLPHNDEPNKALIFGEHGFEIETLLSDILFTYDDTLSAIRSSFLVNFGVSNSLLTAKFGEPCDKQEITVMQSGELSVIATKEGEQYVLSRNSLDLVPKAQSASKYAFSEFGLPGPNKCNPNFLVSGDRQKLTVQWRPDMSAISRVELVETAIGFDHDVITGIEYTTDVDHNSLYTATPQYLCLRDSSSFELLNAVKFDNILADRKIVSDLSGNRHFVQTHDGLREIPEGYNFTVGQLLPPIKDGFPLAGTNDWSIGWDIKGTLEIKDSENERLSRAFLHGYLPGDEVLAACYNDNNLINIVSDIGMQSINKVTYENTRLDCASRQSSAFVRRDRERDRGGKVLYPDAEKCFLVAALPDKTSVSDFYTRPFFEHGMFGLYTSTEEPKIFLYNPKLKYDDGRLPLSTVYDFETQSIPTDSALSIVSGNLGVLALHQNALTFFELSPRADFSIAYPSDTKKFSEGIDIYFPRIGSKSADTVSIVQEDQEMDYSFSKKQLNIKSTLPSEETVYRNVFRGSRWGFGIDTNNSTYLVYGEHDQLVDEDIFTNNQFSFDFVKDIIFDGERVWIKNEAGHETIENDIFYLQDDSLNPESVQISSDSLKVVKNSVVETGVGYVYTSPFETEELYTLDSYRNGWIVDLANREFPVRWVRFSSHWKDRRKNDLSAE
jgi:hypothetical protein